MKQYDIWKQVAGGLAIVGGLLVVGFIWELLQDANYAVTPVLPILAVVAFGAAAAIYWWRQRI